MKAPGALRDHALVARLDAVDAGCVVPPRYDPDGWRPGDGVCQAEAIADYTVRLADRIGRLIGRGDFPLVLGGDCSILLGAALALRRRRAADHGRYGLVFIDGHSDFRHAGNAQYIGAAAGEDLALVTGRGQGDLTNIEGLRPYFREEDIVVLGIREHDEYRMDLKAAGIVFRTVPEIRAEGPSRTAAWAVEELGRVDGFWVHVDVDVLDPAAMPAVDAPDPGGIAFVELEQIIADLVTRPECLGMEVTVFDPDYDPDGQYAAEIVDTLVSGLRPVWALSQQPLPTLAQPGTVDGTVDLGQSGAGDSAPSESGATASAASADTPGSADAALLESGDAVRPGVDDPARSASVDTVSPGAGDTAPSDLVDSTRSGQHGPSEPASPDSASSAQPVDAAPTRHGADHATEPSSVAGESRPDASAETFQAGGDGEVLGDASGDTGSAAVESVAEVHPDQAVTHTGAEVATHVDAQAAYAESDDLSNAGPSVVSRPVEPGSPMDEHR